MRKVNITFGFAAAVCIIFWLDGKACLWFLLSLVFHEAGHLLAMKCTGVPVSEVRLKASGAVIRGGFSGYRQEIACAAAGPFASFLLAFVLFRSVPEPAIISGLLGMTNLLPVYPLDGGRILRAALLLHLEQTVVEKILRAVTATVCCLLMVGACCAAAELQAGLWPIFAALVILWRVGQAGWQEQ